VKRWGNKHYYNEKAWAVDPATSVEVKLQPKPIKEKVIYDKEKLFMHSKTLHLTPKKTK